MPLARKTMAKPTTVQKIIFLAVVIFAGSPPAVKKKNPAIKIIKGKRAIAIQNIKSIKASINSSKVSAFKGLGILIALTKEGIKKENKIIEKIIFLKRNFMRL